MARPWGFFFCLQVTRRSSHNITFDRFHPFDLLIDFDTVYSSLVTLFPSSSLLSHTLHSTDVLNLSSSPAMSGSAVYDFTSKYVPLLADHFLPMNSTTTQNTLYGDVTLDNLSWLERTWAAYYIWMGNPTLATGLMSFMVHEVGSLFFHQHTPPNTGFYGMNANDQFRLCTLEELSHGLLSMRSHTLDSGSCNRYVHKFQHSCRP